MKNEIIDRSKYLTREETLKLLNITAPTFNKYYKDRLTDIIRDKNNNNSIYYNKEEVLSIKVLKEEEEIKNLDNQGSKLAEKVDMSVISRAFQKHLEEADPREIYKSSLALLQMELQKGEEKEKIQEKQIEILENQNKQLEIELGKSKEYYSIKKVCIINHKKERDYKWRLLKQKSVELGYEIKTERDNNYGNVNSYHIEVWKSCYPDERY